RPRRTSSGACVAKHVLMCVSCLVFGSYAARWRPALAIGNSFADGWVDPSLQKSGLAGGRTAEGIQPRPFSSNIGFCTLVLLVQMTSSPQYGEGRGIAGSVAGVFGSRTVNGTRLTRWFTGSRTGK